MKRPLEEDSVAPAKEVELTVDQRLVAQWHPRSWAAQARGLRVRVLAHAGSGKTTALCELAKKLLERNEWLRLSYLCFNKASADAAKARFPPVSSSSGKSGVDCRTIHSALVAYVRRKAKAEGVSNFQCPSRLGLTSSQLADRLDNDAAAGLLSSSSSSRRSSRRRTYAAKMAWQVVDYYCRSDKEAMSVEMIPKWLCRKLDDFDREEGGGGPEDVTTPTRTLVVRYAKRLFDMAADLTNPATIPCTQSVVPKVALRLLRKNADDALGWSGFAQLTPHAIMVDEAQDLDECVLAILELQRQRQTTLVVVGDAAQSIYKFRGASDRALKDSSGKATQQFTLKRSFRFGPNIALEANKTLWLKNRFDRTFDYEPVVGANADFDGTVRVWKFRDDDGTSFPSAPPFTCICRTNQGVVQCAAMILEKCSPDVRLDLGGAAAPLVAKLAKVYDLYQRDISGAAPTDDGVDEDFASFSALAKAVADDESVLGADDDAKDDERAVATVDPILRQATQVVLDLKDRVPQLLARVRGAPDDDNDDDNDVVSFATSHKAKGLEYDAVLVFDDFADIIDKATSRLVTYLRDDDINLWHVAVTRAKRHLWLPEKFDAFSKYLATNNVRCPGHPALPLPARPVPRPSFQTAKAAVQRPALTATFQTAAAAVQRPALPPPPPQRPVSTTAVPRAALEPPPRKPASTNPPPPPQRPVLTTTTTTTTITSERAASLPPPTRPLFPTSQYAPPQRPVLTKTTTTTSQRAASLPPKARPASTRPLQEVPSQRTAPPALQRPPPPSERPPASPPRQPLRDQNTGPQQQAPKPAPVSLSAILSGSRPSTNRYYASRGYSRRR